MKATIFDGKSQRPYAAGDAQALATDPRVIDTYLGRHISKENDES